MWNENVMPWNGCHALDWFHIFSCMKKIAAIKKICYFQRYMLMEYGMKMFFHAMYGHTIPFSCHDIVWHDYSCHKIFMPWSRTLMMYSWTWRAIPQSHIEWVCHENVMAWKPKTHNVRGLPSVKLYYAPSKLCKTMQCMTFFVLAITISMECSIKSMQKVMKLPGDELA